MHESETWFEQLTVLGLLALAMVVSLLPLWGLTETAASATMLLRAGMRFAAGSDAEMAA